ncbi:MAG: DUF2267 domain-containing protein [Vicinamibacterales bacterium]|nr:DUF2267 domain-containing protein [Vicinamibacterales bacterium]
MRDRRARGLPRRAGATLPPARGAGTFRRPPVPEIQGRLALDPRLQEFLNLASVTLGATEQTVRRATAVVLDVVTRAAPAADVQQLLSRVPGAAELLAAFRPAPPPPPPPPANGVAAALGDLVTNAATAIQGTIGSGAALLRLLVEIGFDPQKAQQFAIMFVDFARAYAGSDLVNRVIDAIPGAKQLFGR